MNRSAIFSLCQEGISVKVLRLTQQFGSEFLSVSSVSSVVNLF